MPCRAGDGGRGKPLPYGTTRNGFVVFVGEALGPPASSAPGALAGKARRRNGTAPAVMFPPTRAQWPGGNFEQPLKFCAPEGFKTIS